MSDLTPVGIIIMAVLIQAFLQITPSTFMIFSHYATAKHSKKFRKELQTFYMLGAEMMAAVMLLVVYFVSFHFVMDNPWLDLGMVELGLAGVALALGIVAVFLYFRRGAGTKTFAPRRIASNLVLKAKNIRNRSDAFLLGALAGLPEIIFTLPLYIIVSVALMEFQTAALGRAAMAILVVIATVIPLIIIRLLYDNDKNLADIQKMRAKNKNFYRLMLGGGFMMLAIILVGMAVK